jgi:hypothetical protein
MSQSKNPQEILTNLKQINLESAKVFLAIVGEYKRERISHYNIKYVNLDRNLEERMKRIITNPITDSNNVEEYSFDCPEPEADQVRSINYESTDFYKIFNSLTELNPEVDVITDLKQLLKAKAYMIILRNNDGIFLVGYKTLPESWKMRREKNLITLLYKEKRFSDLGEENVFSISRVVDFFFHDDMLFILSNKEFERGLNFREGMLNNAKELYSSTEALNLFDNIELLKNRVGTNQRYLRKISTIKNMGLYRNPEFLRKLKSVSHEKGWNILYNGDKIVLSEDNIDDVLTLLQDKRLHSELTNKDFDVDSAKLLQMN